MKRQQKRASITFLTFAICFSLLGTSSAEGQVAPGVRMPSRWVLPDWRVQEAPTNGTRWSFYQDTPPSTTSNSPDAKPSAKPNAKPSEDGALTPSTPNDPMLTPSRPNDPMSPSSPTSSNALQASTPSDPGISNASSSLLGSLSASVGSANASIASGERSSSATQSNPSAPGNVVNASDVSATTPTTTGELLQQASSVSVRRTSALNLDPRIRGFNSDQINASASGMTQLKTRVDIDSLFSQIDPGIVRDITVIDGPYTSLHGPGFAFLIGELFPTRRYEIPEMHAAFSLSQDTNGRNFYTRQSVWGGGLNYGVHASYGLRTGNDYHPGGDALDFRIPTSYQKWDGYFSLGLDLTESLRVETSYLRTEQNNVELPGVVYDIAHSKNEQFNLRFVWQESFEEPERAVLQYWWNRTPYHGDATRESKQRTFFRDLLGEPFGPFAGRPIPLNAVTAEGALQSTGVRGLLTWGETDGTQLTIGADWRRQDMAYRETDIDFIGRNSFMNGNIFGIPESSMEDWGLFTNMVFRANEDLSFTVGGRVDFSTAFANAGDIVAFNNGVSRFQNLARDPENNRVLNQPSEILSMLYATSKAQLTEEVSLTAGVAYAMRNPTLADLYSDQPFVPLTRFGNSVSIGNSNLTPERNLQFDLGANGKWEFLTAGMRGFYSHIDNYILYRTFARTQGNGPSRLNRPIPGTSAALGPVADDDSVQYAYTNVDRVSMFGGDTYVEAKLLCWLSMTGTLAYVKGTNHAPQIGDIDGGIGVLTTKGAEGLPGITPLHGTISVRVFDPEESPRWSLDFICRMFNGQNFVADSLGELATPGFTVFDLRAFWRANEHLRFTASVENLLDRTYAEHGSLVILAPGQNLGFVKEPGINLRVGMELEY